MCLCNDSLGSVAYPLARRGSVFIVLKQRTKKHLGRGFAPCSWYRKYSDGWIEQTPYCLPNYSGRCVQGATSNIGETVQAGLPGAVGSVGFRPMDPPNYDSLLSPIGVFSNTDGGAVGNANVTTTSYITGSRDQRLNLDLSAASPLYGASTTVQPPAVKTAILIKHD